MLWVVLARGVLARHVLAGQVLGGRVLRPRSDSWSRGVSWSKR